MKLRRILNRAILKVRKPSYQKIPRQIMKILKDMTKWKMKESLQMKF